MHRRQPPAAPDSSLVQGLLESLAGAEDTPELVETHISWVILSDDFAYKIKKPVVLDFLDFGELNKRRFYCEEEIRLNKPWAPMLYVDVLPVTLADNKPCLGGDGEAIEYAVRMRRFDQDLRLDRQLALDRLNAADSRNTGRVIAARHDRADRAAAERRDHYLAVTREFMAENLDTLEGHADENLLSRLREWTRRQLERLEPVLSSRFEAGLVRDCHGDLHLGNLVRLEDGIQTFDCIEFNRDLREIDVFCDLAFLLMDLVANERHDLAAHCLNAYLEETGDYAGAAVLDLFFVYRCLVRAKVAAIGRRSASANRKRKQALADIGKYTRMARRQATRAGPVLVLMHGFSGSGKTWLAARIMAALPAVRIRSDIERRRLFGLDAAASSASGVGTGIYTPAASARVYARLRELAAATIGSGHSTIVDAAFLEREQRAAARRLAQDIGCETVIVHVDAPVELLRRRLEERALQHDASEADAAVLDHQLESADALDAAELQEAIICANEGSVDIAPIVDTIRSRRKPGDSSSLWD